MEVFPGDDLKISSLERKLSDRYQSLTLNLFSYFAFVLEFRLIIFSHYLLSSENNVFDCF